MNKQQALDNLDEYEKNVQDILDAGALKYFEDTLSIKILNETELGETEIYYHPPYEKLNKYFPKYANEVIPSVERIREKINNVLMIKFTKYNFNSNVVHLNNTTYLKIQL